MSPLLPTDRPPVSRPLAALAGVLAAAVGLAMGELVAGLGRTLTSPVVSVGDRVVDAAPQPVKRLAIDAFGTADKPVLIIGILAVLAVLAGAIGALARPRPVLAAAATAVLGLAGIAAAAQPAAELPLAVLPSLATTLVAVPLLLWLVRPAPPPTPPDTLDARPSPTPRRRFVITAAWALVVGVVAASGGRSLTRRFDVATERAELSLPPPRQAADPIPAAAHPEVDGLPPFLTPNEDFYRIDTSLTVPRLSAEGWTLRVHGMVDRERTFTHDELLDLPSIELPLTLACVSNEVGGDLVGTAVWQGVRLSELLDRVGVAAGATQLVGRAFDGFTTGMPVEAAFDRDTLIAYGMNGEPLPPRHGFPLRMVTPGLYGYVSATKWLSEIELTTFEAFDQYWVERGWDDRAPIRTQSRIDTPGAFGRVPLGGTVPVAGVAWAPTRGISKVEVRVDEGEWQEAELGAPVSDITWRQWVWRWDTTGLEPGRHQLSVRATEQGGQLQTDRTSRPFPSGASGWHTIAVMVEAAGA